MSRILWSSLWLTPALVGATALSAIAQVQTEQAGTTPAAAESPMEQVITYGENTGKTRVGQVTSVSQLSDVRPTDWAFQALQSLVERYGCIVGYPDKTFRGNRALTRYEFAAGLNACLDRVNELIAASTADLVKKEDLDTLRRLQDEFAKELEELKGRVDGLDARVNTLERQQFSTTAKLNAEIIGAYAEVFGDTRAVNSDQQRVIDAQTNRVGRENATSNAIGTRPTRDVQDNAIFGDRVRLNVDASFSGRDRLRTRLQARNITNFTGAVTNTNMTRLGFDGVSGTGNALEMSRLEYRFPLTPLTTVFIGGGTNDGLEFNDSVPTLSPVESSGSGAISRFGRYNPIYRVGTGTGIIINQRLGPEFTFGNKFTLSLGYLAPTGDAQSPALDQGLFTGSYAALAQLVFQPTPALSLGFTYANAYYSGGSGVSGATGSALANNPFGSSGALNTATNVPTEANSYGIQASFRFSPGFILSGWVGLTDAEATRQVNSLSGSAGVPNFGSAADPAVRSGDEATIWNWAVTLALPDFLKEGNLLGIIVGMPPKVTDNDFGPNTRGALTPRREDEDTSIHAEVFYRLRINDNISITPGVLFISNPEHNSENDDIFVGTIRTTFTF